MVLIIGTIAIVAVLSALVAVRISPIASWRSVAMIAASSGAVEAYVESSGRASDSSRMISSNT